MRKGEFSDLQSRLKALAFCNCAVRIGELASKVLD